MDEILFEDEITDEAKARRRALAALFWKILWTFLVIAGFLGLLLPITIYLDWWKAALACLLGLLTGITVTVGVLTSSQNKALITTLLGIILLPGLAVYLSLMAVRGPETYEATSAVMTPFVMYAATGLACGRIVARIWKKGAVTANEKAADRAILHDPRAS